MSCVVKMCKNRSDRLKKETGITFHRFPKENEVWRKDWIDIMRKCNDQDDWMPHKYSVICSVHFEPIDLYKTKTGRLRIVTYAVPTKFLFEPPKMEAVFLREPAHLVKEIKEEPTTEHCVPSASQEPAKMEEEKSAMFLLEPTQIKKEPATLHDIPSTSQEFLFEPAKMEEEKTAGFLLEPTHLVKEEPATLHDIPSTSQEFLFEPAKMEEGTPAVFLFQPTHLVKEQPATEHCFPSASQETTSVTIPATEHPDSSTKILQLETPVESNVSNVLRESISVIGKQAIKQPDTLTLVFPDEQSYMSSTIQENSPDVGPDEEQVPSMPDPPQMRHLKYIVAMKQDIIKKQARKIKTLTQKVKRLEERNKTLKETLKSRKKDNANLEKIITVHLFNDLENKKNSCKKDS